MDAAFTPRDWRECACRARPDDARSSLPVRLTRRSHPLSGGGAVLSAWLGSSFRWVTPRPRRVVQHVVGGVLMGIGARAVPGGNDLLLLWVIPSLAVYGVVAYLVTTATIATVHVTATMLRSNTTR